MHNSALTISASQTIALPMRINPINLAFRFILEVCALTSFGSWGWAQGESLLGKVVFAGLVPLFAAGLWGIFAVPNDPSRSGEALIPIPGAIRFILEITIFISASLCLFSLGYSSITLAFVTAIAIHYLFSYQRLFWLVRQ